MTVAGDLERALRDCTPEAAFGTDTARYEIEGQQPALSIAPESQQQAADVLRGANDASAAVVPWGGGSHMSAGMAPARYDLALDLTRLDRVVEYEPADLTVTVEAGMRLSDLQRRLGEQGQWLTLDPPVGSDATIGGILAVNDSGPGRIAFGTARDVVIGMTVATPRGELVKSGGRVVKNVAGYDMAKLHIGGLGTLGVILQVSMKVAPLPARVLMLEVPAPAIDPACRFALEARDAGLAITGLSVRVTGGRTGLELRLAGSEAAVERSRRECVALAGRLGLGSVVEGRPSTAAWPERATEPAMRIKVSSLPGSLAVRVKEMSAAGADIVAYPAAGIAYGTWTTDDDAAACINGVRALRRSLAAESSSLIIEAAPPELKRALGVWGEARGDFTLMRRLKDEMDPNSILNPGRYVGGI